MRKYFGTEKEKCYNSVVLSNVYLTSYFYFLPIKYSSQFYLLGKFSFYFLRESFCLIIKFLIIKVVTVIGHVTAPTRNMTKFRDIFPEFQTYRMKNGCEGFITWCHPPPHPANKIPMNINVQKLNKYNRYKDEREWYIFKVTTNFIHSNF